MTPACHHNDGTQTNTVPVFKSFQVNSTTQSVRVAPGHGIKGVRLSSTNSCVKRLCCGTMRYFPPDPEFFKTEFISQVTESVMWEWNPSFRAIHCNSTAKESLRKQFLSCSMLFEVLPPFICIKRNWCHGNPSMSTCWGSMACQTVLILLGKLSHATPND